MPQLRIIRNDFGPVQAPSPYMRDPGGLAGWQWSVAGATVIELFIPAVSALLILLFIVLFRIRPT